jgi:hypothetical protein
MHFGRRCIGFKDRATRRIAQNGHNRGGFSQRMLVSLRNGWSRHVHPRSFW